MKRKLFTVIYIGVPVIWLVLQVISNYYDNLSSEGDLPTWLNIILFVGNVILAIEACFTVIVEVVPALKQVRRKLHAMLRFRPWDEEDVTVKNPLSIKQKLWKNVYQYCEREIKEIRDASLLLNGEEISTKYDYYQGFEDFIARRRKERKPSINEDILNDHVNFSIVGDAGLGKSYCLLRLVVQAMKNAGSTPDLDKARIPVFLPLKTWVKRFNMAPDNKIETWLMEEISTSYGISHKNAKWLIQEGALVLCLDGLDEISSEYRAECLQTIMTYKQGVRGVIFSCRKKEFLELLQDEKEDEDDFWDIYEVLPLSTNEIEKVIYGSTTNIEKAQEMYEYLKDKGLIEFVTNPLLLNLFVTVFEELKKKAVDGQVKKTGEEFLNELWELYDKSQFEEKMPKSPLKWLRIRTYLVWIAALMPDENVFYIEQIQPSDWLRNNFDKDKVKPGLTYLFYLFASRIVTALGVSIAVGFFIASPFDFLGAGVMVGILVALLTRLYYHWEAEKPNKWKDFKAFQFGLMVVTVLTGCTLYQGFSIPRAMADMQAGFSATESFSGVILGLIAGVVFSHRKITQTLETDITPVEKFDFNWKSLRKLGVRGGIYVGLAIGTLGILQNCFFTYTTFNNWLEPFIIWVYKIIPNTDINHFDRVSPGANAIIFTLAFIVAFVVGFTIFGIIGGLKTDPEKKNKPDGSKKESNVLNYGIKRSAFNGFLYGIYYGVVALCLYGSFIMLVTRNPDSLDRAWKIGVAIGMLSFFWFGGFEFIQHWTLRIILFASGRVPFLMTRWMDNVQMLAIMRKAGGNLAFRHETMGKYYELLFQERKEEVKSENKRITNLSKPVLKKLLAGFLIVSALVLSVRPFSRKYLTNYFWQRRNELTYNLDTSVKVLSDSSTIVALRNGMLELTVTGTVKLGTFTGSAGPQGATIGFLGVPLKNVFNLVPDFHHGQLLYRRCSDLVWHELAIINKSWLHEDYVSCLKVNKNDTLEFLVNDCEFENNSGHFNLEIKLCDTCSKK